jgi:lipopolysaccharide export system protein LptA
MKAMRLWWTAAAAASICTLGAICPALGQGSGSALRGHNSDAPIDWGAERIEVQDRANRVILTGNVVAKQANLTLNAERITVAYLQSNGIKVQRIDASGGVRLRSPSETARGDFAIYDLGQRLITLIGNVTLTREGSDVNGGRLVLDLDSGLAVMSGSASSGEGAARGRVTGTFLVPKREN